jgi:hypothetical protein
MIYVEKVIIIEFRGIRNLTIDLKKKNFAICGINGTGKSGIVDALEFGLTGNISRLSGKGMGGVSLKDHAPHVDSRNRPDKAKVIIHVSIPSLQKTALIERSVKDPSHVAITPNEPDIIQILNQVVQHPEFALSRRELIRYVITTPGDRAKEVQALLQLQEIENTRAILQKIANSCQKEIDPLKKEKDQAQASLLQTLEITTLSQQKVLDAANLRRKVLGLASIDAMSSSTSLKDGLITVNNTLQPIRVPKGSASAELKKIKELLDSNSTEDSKNSISILIEKLSELNADPLITENVTKEKFLKTALSLVESESCPVCDTEWNSVELKNHIDKKLKDFEAVALKRENAEKELQPYLLFFVDLGNLLRTIEGYGPLFKPIIDITHLKNYRTSLGDSYKSIKDFLPLDTVIKTLESLTNIPEQVLNTISTLEIAITAIPEPSELDASRDYLIIGQERLANYQAISSRFKQVEQKAEESKKVLEAFAKSSTEVLNNIYKEVEGDFSEFYRIINNDDEGGFTAQLTPSIGKLGFNVDFYGRGFFPPGAYHSEGHQDGMGLCLYLALMKHLQGDSFTFAVLDDVLMSVDAGHRREVCKLLKTKFPNTQFVLTTHDEIWLRHMRTAGLITSNGALHFRKWNIDHGPTEWSDRDIWKEIEDCLNENDVRAAAGLLRHYLEYISGEICNSLRAPVEFRSDHQFELGDLLPAAIGRFKSLLKDGKAVANSWSDKTSMEAITKIEEHFTTCLTASQIEQWQVNPAIHYNEWINFHPADFGPVVESYRNLIAAFNCSNCNSIIYLALNRGVRESVRCTCGSVNINLRKR